MRKLLIALVLLSGTLIGCTVGETPREHAQRHMLQADVQMRTMVEDWDYFWLAERNSRLTRWYTRLGY